MDVITIIRSHMIPIGSDRINIRSGVIRSDISVIRSDLIEFKICNIRSNLIGSDVIDIGSDLIGSDNMLDQIRYLICASISDLIPCLADRI